MVSLLELLLYAFIAAKTWANPLGLLQSGVSDIASRQFTGDVKSYYRQTYTGIYWGDAEASCTPDHLKILQETTRMLGPFTADQDWGWDESAAWNRFFVNSKQAQRGSGWHDGTKNRNAFLSIKSNLVQLNKFPSTGKKSRSGDFVQSKQVSYTCKEQPQFNKCSRSRGLAAYAMTPAAYGNQGFGIMFCPLFFTKRYLNDVTDGTHKPVSALASLYTYEHLLAHELLHCDIIGTKEHVVDMVGDIPGQRDGQTIYGASLCHEWAWKDQRNRRGPVNIGTALNADSYSWFLTNRWFDKAWQWNEYAKGDGRFRKRDGQDDGTQDFTPDDMTDYPQDTDEGPGTNVAGVDPQFADSANCILTGTDEDNNWVCSYVGEVYSDFVNEVSQSGGMPMQTSPPSQTTPMPDPSATLTASA